MTYLTVSGAYGRDYKSLKAAKADWDAGKDFVIRTLGPHDGRYINNADLRLNPCTLMVRYKADRQIGKLA